ncbi:hypothetical protein TRICI_000273 [Trichomonascus ciferrii]|uniref:Uncharacterized protein n=1 Tax=Trichomonascus ciferrii TaxID=44093 RepID=A0A642VDW4_9ASCO|nr:hypothetical protein TRICI_000273 [Trichomonascus ciferrii]
MMDRAMSDRTVPDNFQSGESGGLEEPLNENYLCLRFSEKGWASKIEAAISASKSGNGDFVVEFIEFKGKLTDYIHWYFQRFVQRRHLLTADYSQGICIAILPRRKHERGVRHYDQEFSTSIEAIGPGVSNLCSIYGSADVRLSQSKIQPDSSYEPRMSEILRASQFRVESVVLMIEYERSLKAYSYDFFPERILAMVQGIDETQLGPLLRCGRQSAERKIEELELVLRTVTQTRERIRDIVVEKVGPEPGRQRDDLLVAISTIVPHREAIDDYIRHLKGLLPNVQVGAPTENDYTNCYDVMKSRQGRDVEYIDGESVPEQGVFIRTSSLLGFYDPDHQQIPEHIQLTGHQLKTIFRGYPSVLNDDAIADFGF